MKNKIKENKWFIIGAILLFIYIYYKLSFVDHTFGDTPWFQQYTNYGILNFINWRWSNWTSRIFLEAILLFMLMIPVFFWKLITSFMFVLIYYSILKILKQNFEKQKLFVFLLFHKVITHLC